MPSGPHRLFAAYPGLRFAALGSAPARPHLDLEPLGIAAEFLDAAAEPAWVERYLAVNQACFSGPLTLPGWVLADLYLLPSAIGLVLDGEGITAAYYAAPALEAGTVVGVSLLSTRPGLGVGYTVKALTLAMYRARIQRGVTQWHSRALGIHTRFGTLEVEGPAPSVHGMAEDSFIYRVVFNQTAQELGKPVDIPTAKARVAAGERVRIVAPGLTRAGDRIFLAS